MSKSTQYVIVRYVPDAVADERINIGVLATNGDRAAWKPVSNWERAKAFGGEDVAFLQEFSQKLSQDIADGNLTGAKASKLMQKGQGWMNSIQMSEARHSLESIETFMQTFPQTVLKSDGMQQVEPEEKVDAPDSRHDYLSRFANWNMREFFNLFLLTESVDLGCAMEVVEEAWDSSTMVEEFCDLEEAIDHLGDMSVKDFAAEVLDLDVEPDTKPAYASPVTYLQSVASDHVRIYFSQTTYRGHYAQLEADWYERNISKDRSASQKTLSLVREAAHTDMNAIAEEFELIQPMKPAVKQLWEALKQDRHMQATGRTVIEGDDYRIIAMPESFEIRRNQGTPIAFTWNEGEVPRLNSTVDKTEAAALASKVQAAVQAIGTPSRPAQTKVAGIEI